MIEPFRNHPIYLSSLTYDLYHLMATDRKRRDSSVRPTQILS